MPAKVTRNAKEISGANSIEIAGNTATVDVQLGSELDGLLYYNLTRKGKPRLGIEIDNVTYTSHRYDIGSPDRGVYKLSADMEIRS